MTVVDDNYTGHVEPGTAARRILPGASIVKASVGPMDNNAYLVTCSQTGETLLIDAANDAAILLDLIEQHAPKLTLIVTSHQHHDHWLALEEVAKATGVPTAAHQLDADPLPVKPDRILADGDTVNIGDLTFDVIHLQGHTEGSVALALGGAAAATRNCSPATACFRAASERPGSDGDFDALLTRRDQPGVRRLPGLDRGLSRPRRRHDPGRGTPAPGRMARAGLVTPSRPP